MKTERPTAVSRNGEKCGKFMYFFRKKYYLSGKLSGYEVRHFLKPRHVKCNIFSELTLKASLPLFRLIFFKKLAEKICVISEI
jgi:hypothetical protein